MNKTVGLTGIFVCFFVQAIADNDLLQNNASICMFVCAGICHLDELSVYTKKSLAILAVVYSVLIAALFCLMLIAKHYIFDMDVNRGITLLIGIFTVGFAIYSGGRVMTFLMKRLEKKHNSEEACC
ncbi:hypothetical protein [Bacillus swezeyi]|uniref:hypothetical protein n=1 Tax=Bacillus swezeyi TaxID=1925020 RepID=UPI003F8A3650